MIQRDADHCLEMNFKQVQTAIEERR